MKALPESNIAMSNKRNSNIELLRIVTMVMIVGCHFATHGGFEFNHQSITIPRLWWNLLEMGGHFGVDVFVLISGYYLIENRELFISPKKIIKFWGQVLFYSVGLLGLLCIIKMESIMFINIIKAFLPITFSQWWFASTYFVMFLIHPYVNKLLQSFSRKEYQYFLLLTFFLWSIIPTFTTSTFQSNPLIEFLFFYSIAGYIKLWGFHQQTSSKIWFSYWFLFSAIKYILCVIFMIIGKQNEFFSTHSLFFYNRQSILTVLSAICFFMAFSTLKPRSNPFINEISSAAFGVYLLHDSALLRTLLWKKIFHNASFQNTILIIPYSITVIAVVYILCTIIDLIRKHFIEKPTLKFIDSHIDKYITLFSKFFAQIRISVFKNDEM